MVELFKRLFVKGYAETPVETPVEIDVVNDPRITRIDAVEARRNVERITPTDISKINEAYKMIEEASKEHSTQIDLWEYQGFNQEIADMLKRDGYKVKRQHYTRTWWEVSW